MIRLSALLLLACASCFAQDPDPGLAALKARQAKLHQKKAGAITPEERQKAMSDRGGELTTLLEGIIADAAKEGVEFKKLSNDEATSQFPKYETVSGRGADGLVVHVDNSYTHELELVAQPVGGKMFKMTWAFYKDGSFKVGENVSRGGQVFFAGKNYLDPQAVLPNREAIKAGLLKFLNSL